MKAFNLGVNKPNRSSLRRQEDECKKKEEEQHTEQVFKDFVASFEGHSKSRTWIKGGVVNPNCEDASGGSRVYRPTSKFEELQCKQEKPEIKKSVPEKPPVLGKKKVKEQKKSKLEQFKEELKLIQQQREQRHAMKSGKGSTTQMIHSDLDLSDVSRGRDYKFFGSSSQNSGPGGGGTPGSFYGKRQRDRRDGSYMNANAFMAMVDYPYDFDGDRTTTNLFLGNLNPKMTEQQLCDAFGRYGPLASVKIMWPRTEEERSRGRNCGFVAFMNRTDGERALENIRGKELMGFEMKLGWGKSVPIPLYPVYIPPPLLELIKPPPPSGLPFNAQPRDWLKSVRQVIKQRAKMVADGSATESDTSVPPGPDRKPFDINKLSKEELKEVLKDAVVKVVTPSDRSVLALIHRLIEFVVLEGPHFEAAIMHREANNPQFKFLFDYQSSDHTYYRWKLWSILHGESVNNWRTEEFRMFENGPFWRPPPLNLFTAGMPEELVEEDDYPYAPGYVPPPNSKRRDAEGIYEDLHSEASIARRCGLTEAQRGRFTQMLIDLEPGRSNVGDLMVWCLEHADSAADITDCIVDSLHPDSANTSDVPGELSESHDGDQDDEANRRSGKKKVDYHSADAGANQADSEPSVRKSDGPLEDKENDGHTASTSEGSTTPSETPIQPLSVIKLVARIYLVSDILYNSSAKVPNASYFRKCFENRLLDLFSYLHLHYKNAEGKLKAEQLKVSKILVSLSENLQQKVITCFRAWEEWAIYPNDFLIKLQNVFLGLISDPEDDADLAGVPLPPEELSAPEPPEIPKAFTVLHSDVEVLEGQSLVQYDGDPLDVDGSPLNENSDEPPIPAKRPTTAVENKPAGGALEKQANRLFVPSKWESVDPETVEAEAVSTTSRWELLVDPQGGSRDDGDFPSKWSRDVAAEDDELDGRPLDFAGGDDDNSGFNLVAYDDEDAVSPVSVEREQSLERTSIFTNSTESNRLSSINPEPPAPSSSTLSQPSGSVVTEERRALLREIEVKVMKYQDDLEASRKMNSSITDDAIIKQTRRYRERLMDRLNEDESLLAIKPPSKGTPTHVSKSSKSSNRSSQHDRSKQSSDSANSQSTASSRRRDCRDRSPPRSFRDRDRVRRPPPSSSPSSPGDACDSLANGNPALHGDSLPERSEGSHRSRREPGSQEKSATASQSNNSASLLEELEEGEASDEEDSAATQAPRSHSKRKYYGRDSTGSSDQQSTRKKHRSRSPDSQNSPNRRRNQHTLAGGGRRR